MDSIPKIRIVTDSSSDITWEYADQKGIKIVPLTIRFEDKIVKETRDYDFDKHYQTYHTNKNFSPKTAQPSPQEFYSVFMELIDEGVKDIIVICISSKLSGTMNSAKVAKDQINGLYRDVNIYLVDSKNASYGEGFLIEQALSFIEEGYEANQIVSYLERHIALVKSFLLIPTLKYLYQGGRISITKYLLARFLRKMAIIKSASDGTLQPVGAISHIPDGLKKIVTIATENGKLVPQKIAIVHALNTELRDQALDYIRGRFQIEKIIAVQTRAAITAHVGPTSIAIVFDFWNGEK